MAARLRIILPVPAKGPSVSSTYPSTDTSPGLDSAPTWADPAEADKFEAAADRYLTGDLDPEAFRRLRLRQGIYGTRQLLDIQMIRTKIPGGALGADALQALADVAEQWSRGWGHLTTRQNVQFHFVRLQDVPTALRRLAEAGLTTREAGGDSVRNVTACPLAGVCRDEVLDVNAAAEAVARHFLRSPLTEHLPRKFKIAASGCPRDCALGVIHDVGIVATEQAGRKGFRLLVGGGLGTSPRTAQELEPLTEPADLLVTAEAVLRVWSRDTPDPTKRARTRLKFLVAKLGIAAFREKVLAERAELRRAPGYQRQVPEDLLPPRTQGTPRPDTEPSPDHSEDPAGYQRWRTGNVVEQKQPGRYAAYVTTPLGDVTAAQFRALAAAAREFGVAWRTTLRQNLVARNLRAGDLPRLYHLLAGAALAVSSVDSAADVVSCPGAETCNLALTASRGAATEVINALRAAGLDHVGPLSINISGCHNSCAQQQLADIGLSGQVRRVGQDEAPGYRIVLGGGISPDGARFGEYVAKAPAKRIPEVIVALVGRFTREHAVGERFGEWVDRVGPETLGAWLEQFDDRRTRQEAPEMYTDWGESKPFEVILGRGECA